MISKVQLCVKVVDVLHWLCFAIKGVAFGRETLTREVWQQSAAMVVNG